VNYKQNMLVRQENIDNTIYQIRFPYTAISDIIRTMSMPSQAAGHYEFNESTVMKLNRKEFDKAVRRAYNRIPAEIRDRMENVVLTVKKRPSGKMLKEMGYPPNEPILGLYDGVSLQDHSFFFSPSPHPDTITVFQEPLEEMCESLAELEREIEITVVHEVAHFLGISDERLEELGYG